MRSFPCCASLIMSYTLPPLLLIFQAEDGIRDHCVTGVQTCALPISSRRRHTRSLCDWSSDVCSSDLTHSSAQCHALLEAGNRPLSSLLVLRQAAQAHQRREIGRASCRERV